MPLELRLNGVERTAAVEPATTLLELLHDVFGMADVRYGCGEGVCGTCTVLLDGEPVSACLLLAIQAAGREVVTLTGLMRDDGGMHPLQAAFLQCGASQCGFCTPGMVLTAHALCERVRMPTRDDIRYELVGNLCRCTGYTKIFEAIERYVAERHAAAGDAIDGHGDGHGDGRGVGRGRGEGS